VRIPVHWGTHTSEVLPFVIEPNWLDRVEQVVDWGLARDMFIIINAHHEWWLAEDYSVSHQARFDSIWTQISQRFQDKSEKLFFEIINEPHGLTAEEADSINARVLPIIRETNPTRIVIYSGAGWSAVADMLNAAIPADDYIMAYWHSYDPWSFAGEGQGSWGSVGDLNAIIQMFAQAGGWSQTNSLPVMISEFGAIHDCDYNSRMRHYFTYVEEAVKNNIAFQAWDDGGNFGLYNRDPRTWPEVKDILMYTYPDSPTSLEISTYGDTSVVLTWENRTVDNSQIHIERRAGDEEFTRIAQLPALTTEYQDSGFESNNFITYRVIAAFSGQPDKYSYPVRVIIEPSERSNYLGTAYQIPAEIQAEDYDIGGEDWTYHDTDVTNIPGAYRPWEGVDIAERNTGGFHVTNIEAGEWLEYTVQITESRDYEITIYLASLEGGGYLRFETGANFSTYVPVPSTGDWDTLTPVTTSIYLPEGLQYLRLRFITIPAYNVDRFSIE